MRVDAQLNRHIDWNFIIWKFTEAYSDLSLFYKSLLIFIDSHSFCSGWKSSMNQSYLNGPFQELNKRFRISVKIITEKRYLSSLYQGINYLRFAYCYICYLWSKSDGPLFMFKLWMLILDRLFRRLYSFNQNPICRSPNHSSVLSKKQNIGWFF